MRSIKFPTMRTISLLTMAGILGAGSLKAAEAAPAADAPTYFSNPLFIAMISIIVLLFVIILVLGNVVKGAAHIFKGRTNKTLAIIGLLMLSSGNLFAWDSPEINAKLADGVGGIDSGTFTFLLIIILVELAMIAALLTIVRTFVVDEKAEEEVAKTKKAKASKLTFMEKMNAMVEIEKEKDLLLDHDYDGIRELDNNLPPWWKYGFYLTIVVGLFYLVHYHISGTGDLQIAEYNKELKKAEADIAAYMKTAANNVDETTVKVSKDPSDLAAGKDMFVASCAACHGKLGEGGVGPNLTDPYWLHGGGIVEVFKSLKYGWPDKGMKAWKEDFSPSQLAQISSYVLSLQGTNPPNAKEKQGDLWVEAGAAAPADSATAPIDSAAVAKADTTAKTAVAAATATEKK